MESLLEDMEDVVAPDLSAEATDWCTSCQALKQQLAQVREEQVQNFQKLKQKIISTDLLIKKYKSKCDEHDIQCKKTDDAIKRADRYQRQTEILETQLKAALLDTEPLRQSKISLEKQLSERTSEVQTLSDRILSLEGVNRQYDNLSRANSVDLERLQAERKEHLARIKCLESGKLEKGEAKEYKSEISSLKKEKTTLTKANNRLEKKLCAAMAKIELMRNNQKSSPHGRKHTGSVCSSSPIKSPGVMCSPKIFKPSPRARAQLRSTSDRNSSSQATDILDDPVDKKPVSEMGTSSSDDSDDDQTSLLSFKWTLSPVAPCISPLPPTPLCVDKNKIHGGVSPQSDDDTCNDAAAADDDDVSEMADQLELQLLQMEEGPQQLESIVGAKSEASQMENSSDVPISAMDNIVKLICDGAVPCTGTESVEQSGTVTFVQVCFSDKTEHDRAPVEELAKHNRDTGEHVLTETSYTQKIVGDIVTEIAMSNAHVKQKTIGNCYTSDLSDECSETPTKQSTCVVTKQENDKFKDTNGKTNAPKSKGNHVQTIEGTSLIENMLTNTSVQSDQTKAVEKDENTLNHQDEDQGHEDAGLDFGETYDNKVIGEGATQMNKYHDSKLKVDRTDMKDIVDIQIWKEDQVETIKGLALPPVTSCFNCHEIELDTKSVTQVFQKPGIEKKDNLSSKESIDAKEINNKGSKDMLFGSKTSCNITRDIKKGSCNTLKNSDDSTEKTDFDFIEGYNIISRDSVKANNSPKALDKNVKKKLGKTKQRLFQNCKYVDHDSVESSQEIERKEEVLECKMVPVVELCELGGACTKQFVNTCAFDKTQSLDSLSKNTHVKKTGLNHVVPVLQTSDSSHAFRPVQSVAHKKKDDNRVGQASKEIEIKHNEENKISAWVRDINITNDTIIDNTNNNTECGVTRQLSTGFTVHSGYIERRHSSEKMKPFKSSQQLKIQIDGQNTCDTIDEEDTNLEESVTILPTDKSEEHFFSNNESLRPTSINKMNQSEESVFQQEGSTDGASHVKNIIKNTVRIVSDDMKPGCLHSTSAGKSLPLSASLLITNTFKTVSKQHSECVDIMGGLDSEANLFRSISRGSSPSLESLNRTSPLSPLSLSPFCFTNLISPLPPSPVRDLQRVSPLSPTQLGEGDQVRNCTSHKHEHKCVKTEVASNYTSNDNSSQEKIQELPMGVHGNVMINSENSVGFKVRISEIKKEDECGKINAEQSTPFTVKIERQMPVKTINNENDVSHNAGDDKKQVSDRTGDDQKQVSDMTQDDKKQVSDMTQDDKKQVSEMTQDDKKQVPDRTWNDKKQVSDMTQDDKKQVSDMTQDDKKQVPDMTQDDKKQVPDMTQNDKKQVSEMTQNDKKQVPDMTQDDKKQVSDRTWNDKKQVSNKTIENEKDVPIKTIDNEKEVSHKAGDNKELVLQKTDDKSKQVSEIYGCLDDTESNANYPHKTAENGFKEKSVKKNAHTVEDGKVIKEKRIGEKKNMDSLLHKSDSGTVLQKEVEISNLAQSKLSTNEIKSEMNLKFEMNESFEDNSLTGEGEMSSVSEVPGDIGQIQKSKSYKFIPNVKSDKDKGPVKSQTVSARVVPLDLMKLSPVPAIISPIKTPVCKVTKVIQPRSKAVNLTECFIPKQYKRRSEDTQATTKQQNQDSTRREKLKKLKQDVANSDLCSKQIMSNSLVKKEKETKTFQNVGELGCVRKSGRVMLRKRSKSPDNKNGYRETDVSHKEVDIETASIPTVTIDDTQAGYGAGDCDLDIDDITKEEEKVPSGMDNWAFKRRTRLAHKSDIRPLRPGMIKVIDPPLFPPSVSRQARKRMSDLSLKPAEDACKQMLTEKIQQKSFVGVKQRKDDMKKVHGYLKSTETPEVFIAGMMSNQGSSRMPDLLLSLCVEVLGKVTTDSLDTVYEVCLTDRHRDLHPTHFPFLNDIDRKALQLLQHLQSKPQYGISYQTVLSMLWQSIFSREISLTIVGKMSLCRVYTAVCATKGDVERARVLIYHIYTCGHLSSLELLVPVVSVWPRVLQRHPGDHLGNMVTPGDPPDKNLTPVITLVFEELISRSLIEMANDFGKKVMCILQKLCHWTSCPGNAELILTSLLNRLADVTHPDSMDHACIFELVQGACLLLSHQPWSWVWDQFVKGHGLQSSVNRYCASHSSVPMAPEYMCAILQITSSALFVHSHTIPSEDLQQLANTWLLPLLHHQPGSAKVRNSCLETLLELCPFHPPLLVSVQDWFSRNLASVHDNMVHRLEELRCSLKLSTGVICMPFVK
ncbi:uncharacterized protein LOC127833360 isoform X2 [Dreissena polymorpha]|uniref:uncharacterized protein LOC127833360 isoform X2 n=1 Tax=Dreissena polymorpha TaxID=45954 RepID=UPI002265548F|nr:uncharacterized protein LOC127833360 isoform X2 [Dreissena polymorpha]